MRKLTRQARHEPRVQLTELRKAGHTCDAIAALTGLSRTGVFDICKHHAASGPSMLHDTVGGHKPGQHRLLKHLSKQGHAQGVPAVGSAS